MSRRFEARLQGTSGNCANYRVGIVGEEIARWQTHSNSLLPVDLHKAIGVEITPLLHAVDGLEGPCEDLGPVCWQAIMVGRFEVCAEIYIPLVAWPDGDLPMTISEYGETL